MGGQAHAIIVKNIQSICRDAREKIRYELQQKKEALVEPLEKTFPPWEDVRKSALKAVANEVIEGSKSGYGDETALMSLLGEYAKPHPTLRLKGKSNTGKKAMRILFASANRFVIHYAKSSVTLRRPPNAEETARKFSFPRYNGSRSLYKSKGLILTWEVHEVDIASNRSRVRFSCESHVGSDDHLFGGCCIAGLVGDYVFLMDNSPIVYIYDIVRERLQYAFNYKSAFNSCPWYSDPAPMRMSPAPRWFATEDLNVRCGFVASSEGEKRVRATFAVRDVLETVVASPPWKCTSRPQGFYGTNTNWSFVMLGQTTQVMPHLVVTQIAPASLSKYIRSAESELHKFNFDTETATSRIEPYDSAYASVPTEGGTMTSFATPQFKILHRNRKTEIFVLESKMLCGMPHESVFWNWVDVLPAVVSVSQNQKDVYIYDNPSEPSRNSVKHYSLEINTASKRMTPST